MSIPKRFKSDDDLVVWISATEDVSELTRCLERMTDEYDETPKVCKGIMLNKHIKEPLEVFFITGFLKPELIDHK